MSDFNLELSRKQCEYIKKANKRWNFKIGATRCGKTFLDFIYIIPQRILERKGKKGLKFILGVSKLTIERNILEPMRQHWGDDLIGTINSENICKIFGEKVHCLGAEKVSQVAKLRGAEASYIYGDETVEWNEEVFQLMKSRLSLPYSCFDGTGNPADPNHWLKLFIDDLLETNPDSIYLQEWSIYDNPFLPREFVRALESEYAGTVYYDRYILGKWTRAEGIIYRPFADNNEDYIIDEIPDNIMYITCGVDFGGNKSKHSFTCTGFTRFFNEVIILESERVETDLTPDKLEKKYAEFISMCIKKYKKPILTYADSAEQVLIRGFKDIILKNYLKNEIYNAKKMQVKDRINLVIRLLGQKRLFVRRHCKSVINALNTAIWDKDHPDERLDDGTTDIDTMDSLEYSIEPHYKELIDRLGG